MEDDLRADPSVKESRSSTLEHHPFILLSSVPGAYLPTALTLNLTQCYTEPKVGGPSAVSLLYSQGVCLSEVAASTCRCPLPSTSDTGLINFIQEPCWSDQMNWANKVNCKTGQAGPVTVQASKLQHRGSNLWDLPAWTERNTHPNMYGDIQTFYFWVNIKRTKSKKAQILIFPRS